MKFVPSAWMSRLVFVLKNNPEELEKQLADKVDRLEIASRRDNLKFFGIPESTDENHSLQIHIVFWIFYRAVFLRNHDRQGKLSGHIVEGNGVQRQRDAHSVHNR